MPSENLDAFDFSLTGYSQTSPIEEILEAEVLRIFHYIIFNNKLFIIVLQRDDDVTSINGNEAFTDFLEDWNRSKEETTTENSADEADNEDRNSLLPNNSQVS